MTIAKVCYAVATVLFILALLIKVEFSLVTAGLAFLGAGHVVE